MTQSNLHEIFWTNIENQLVKAFGYNFIFVDLNDIDKYFGMDYLGGRRLTIQKLNTKNLFKCYNITGEKFRVIRFNTLLKLQFIPAEFWKGHYDKR